MSEGGKEIPQIRPEISKRLGFANTYIETGAWGLPKDVDSHDPAEVFEGPLLDLNDRNTSPDEATLVMGWMEEKLGEPSAEAKIGAQYVSPDGTTTISVFEKEIAEGWKLAIRQSTEEGSERPSYIFWPEEVYEWQEEMGYTKKSPQK